jgi:hypothetical protein
VDLTSMRRWIGGTWLAWREFFVGPSPANIPPSLPYRCGTMLMRCSLEGMERVARSWDEDEERFIAWVAAHPTPRAEWLEDVERLRRGR